MQSSITLLFLILVSLVVGCMSLQDDRKVYIVYMGKLPSDTVYAPTSHHQSLVQEILQGSNLVDDILVHSYKRSFNGFSAKLTTEEAEKLVGMDGVVSVFESKKLQLQTTRSWDFLGFPETVARVPTAESDVIIGVLDSGIWPESESFSDEGFGPPPEKWKGVCEGGPNFTCNNKIIGARVYAAGVASSLSAIDIQGHGTHTASTAAGKKIEDSSFFGLAKGTARGAVPSARIAVYKVCSLSDCDGHAILAGFDDAIADGVDILSVSLGHPRAYMFYDDPIAIGSFHAVEKDILTSHSAGNEGPSQQSVSSTAPWLFTVGASSTDRRLMDLLVLGNGETYMVDAVNAFNMNEIKFPLLYGANGLTGCYKEKAQLCKRGCLDRELVKGKIVVCDAVAGVAEAFESGALGAIFIEKEFYEYDTIVYPLSASLLSSELGERVKSYINTTKDPVATILKTQSILDYQAPVVSSFSSRGPNSIIPDIIKPDIAAPGVTILASFSPLGHPFVIAEDGTSVKLSIMSGTSMACPHVTGAAAYVKSFHPEWPASFIKSALMTSASDMNNSKNPAREFSYGSGQINPIKAVDPGLVYQVYPEDYINMLCDVGIDAEKIQIISNRSCPEDSVSGNARDLNYPSLGAHVADNIPFTLTFTRTVTNVGNPSSTYYATIRTDSVSINVTVIPDVLSFESLMESKSFVVNVVGSGLAYSETATGSLVWTDGMHSVRSPLVVYAYNFEP